MASKILLSKFNLSGIVLKNRFAMAPMTRSRAGVERMPNSLMAKYYTQRADAGLIITEATVISEQANGWLNTPGILSDEQMTAWKQVVDALHQKGTPVYLQLWHCGRASHSSFQKNGQLPVAPSAIKIEGDSIHTPTGKQPYEVPRALETSEVSAIVEDYRSAAKRALEAGFDGIEIHAANGYLIDQFLESKTNKRTDNYGGSVENRYRFLQEIVTAVSTVFPSNKVGVRLSPNGNYNDMGSPDFRETFLFIAQQLDSLKLGYLHILDGTGFGFHKLGEPMTLKEFRAVFSASLIGNVGYDFATAETAIADGSADLIAFGRPFISNPDLVQRYTHDWPLNAPAEMKDWYAFTEEGYTDFPTYEAKAAATKV